MYFTQIGAWFNPVEQTFICDSCIFSDAVGSYAENQRITAVRKVYQRGVINPMINIEALWKDYGNYENVIISYVCQF